MAHSSQTNVMDTHDYAISMDLRYDAEIIPLPETPEKLPVAKKSRVALNDDVPNSVLLTAIEKKNRQTSRGIVGKAAVCGTVGSREHCFYLFPLLFYGVLWQGN